jgi:hypothetical protein
MVAASATATFIDIDTSPCPKRIVQNDAKPGNRRLAQRFLTAPVNRMVSTHGRRGLASRANKGNVGNKVNDLKTTLGGKDAGAATRALTSA